MHFHQEDVGRPAIVSADPDGGDAMSCSKHVLNVHWEHHSWHTRVTLAEDVTAEENSMWGCPVTRTEVRCFKEDVCTACGAIRRRGACVCDTAKAEHCAVRLACVDESQQSTAH